MDRGPDSRCQFPHHPLGEPRVASRPLPKYLDNADFECRLPPLSPYSATGWARMPPTRSARVLLIPTQCVGAFFPTLERPLSTIRSRDSPLPLWRCQLQPRDLSTAARTQRLSWPFLLQNGWGYLYGFQGDHWQQSSRMHTSTHRLL